MTPKETKDACVELAKAIGPRSKVYCSINVEDNKGSIRFSLYDSWPSGSALIQVLSEEFGAGFEDLRTKWTAYQDLYRRDKVKQMALKIIEITALHGECTDAALRGCWMFDDKQIDALGQDACEEANRMAANGPFSIVVKGGANGAPSDVEAA